LLENVDLSRAADVAVAIKKAIVELRTVELITARICRTADEVEAVSRDLLPKVRDDIHH
jgi:hypothetical protein